jgi:hypothetical protein
LFYLDPYLEPSSCMRKSYYFMFYASLEPIVYIQFVLNFFYIARKSVNIKIVSPTLRLSQNPRRNTVESEFRHLLHHNLIESYLLRVHTRNRDCDEITPLWGSGLTAISAIFTTRQAGFLGLMSPVVCGYQTWPQKPRVIN